jgi:O-antigen/teichoic acid export membrane protein
MLTVELTDHLRGRIARGAAGTLGLLVFNIGVRFLIGLAIARMLGAAGYGAYSFALTCVTALAVLALLGFDVLLVREVANYQTRSQWGLLRGLLERANQFALLASVLLSLTVAGLAWGLASRLEPQMLTALWVGLLVVPALVLMRLKRAIMQGLHRVVASQAPEMVIQPMAFAALMALAFAALDGYARPPAVVGLYGVATVVALLVAARQSNRALPAEMKRAAPAFASGPWTRSALTFCLSNGMHVLSASSGIILLGLIKGPEATGVFSVANMVALLIAVPLMAVNVPLTPAVAEHHASGNKPALQRLATKSARSAFLFSLPIALLCLVFGQLVLRIFGAEFTAGYAALGATSRGALRSARSSISSWGLP